MLEKGRYGVGEGTASISSWCLWQKNNACRSFMIFQLRIRHSWQRRVFIGSGVWCLYFAPSLALRLRGSTCSQVPPDLRKCGLGTGKVLLTLVPMKSLLTFYCNIDYKFSSLEQIYSVWILSWIASRIMRLSVPIVRHLFFTSLVSQKKLFHKTILCT